MNVFLRVGSFSNHSIEGDHVNHHCKPDWWRQSPPARRPVDEAMRHGIRHRCPAFPLCLFEDRALLGDRVLFEDPDRIALAMAALVMLGPLGALLLGYG